MEALKPEGAAAVLIWMRGGVHPASFLLALVLAAVLGGCGSESSAPSTTTAKLGGIRRSNCQPVGEAAEGSFELCFQAGQDEHGRFILDTGSTRRELDVSPPEPTPTASAAGKVGHWAWGALAPDGQRIVAQWSAECEVPIAFFVDLESGEPEPVTGEHDWAKSPDSVALGWTTDGRAIVFLPRGPACGSGIEKPGIYLYSSAGRGRLLLQADRSPIRGSIEPRSVSAIRAEER
jgi:hypothetical protein